MKALFSASLAVLALAGCANFEYTQYGEWLDQVSVRPARPVVHTPEQQQALLQQAASLRAQAEELREKLALERSRVQRIAYLRQLQWIGDELRPVENALNGGPMPPPKPDVLGPLPRA